MGLGVVESENGLYVAYTLMPRPAFPLPSISRGIGEQV